MTPALRPAEARGLRRPSVLVALALLAAVGCAPKVPTDLASARQAYEHARVSDAAVLAPAELHVAAGALADAEAAFDKHPRDYETVDLAYVAHRKAQMAEATAAAEKSRAAGDAAASALVIEQAAQLADAKDELAASETARVAAADALAKLAAVKEEARGLVITLSGSVLFTSGESTLLASAEAKLAQVAAALGPVAQSMVVEGHTDAQGSDADNLALSQRRADAVRAYLISHGCAESLVSAVGLGETHPIGSNDTAEGRANNRRVEIVLQKTTPIASAP